MKPIEFVGNTYEEKLADACRIINFYRFDKLTGYKLRSEFDERLRECVQDKDFFSFAMFDLNDLHNINYDYGHSEGDRYITTFSELLLSLFPNEEFYRIGGDEFAMLSENINQKYILQKIEELSNDQKEMFCYGVVDQNEINTDYISPKKIYNFVDSLIIDAKSRRKVKRK